MNKKILSSITAALVCATVFAASFGIGFALQIKNAESASFTIGSAPKEVKTKVYYQSSFFYGGTGKVYAYAWDSVGTNGNNAAYPGVEMTAEDYKHGLYSYEVSEKFDKIIFNAGIDDVTTKTGDLTINRTNIYYSQHNNSWKSALSECTFSYYLVGKLSGNGTWDNTHKYENGFLKNYAGGNVNEYLNPNYVLKAGDQFKATSEDGIYFYGGGGSTSGDPYDVRMANSLDKTASVYFTPGSNLYCGVDFSYYANCAAYGYDWNCYAWVEGTGTNNGWPGVAMTRLSGASYWYSANIPVYYNSIIFNNNGKGKQTGDLKYVDISYPCFDGTWKESM